MHRLNEIGQSQLDMLKTLLGIQSSYIEEGSFRLWAGVPAPRDRWLMMKLIFLHKLLTDRDGVDTLLHHWIDTGQLDEGSTIYQEMMIAQQTLLGHMDRAKLCKLKRKNLVKAIRNAINGTAIEQLHHCHPLRALEWKQYGFDAFAALEPTECITKK